MPPWATNLPNLELLAIFEVWNIHLFSRRGNHRAIDNGQH